MNKWIGCGRLTAEPDKKYSSKKTDMAVTRYTLAIDTGYGDNKRTDFIRCVAFGKAGEFASTYFHKGQRVLVEGSIKLGEYTNKDGQKIPTTDIIIESQEFADGVKQVEKKDEPTIDDFADAYGDDSVPF